MKTKLHAKSFIAGIIITMMLFTIILAEPIENTIRIFYNNIKIYVDNKLVNPLDTAGNKVEPFIYNGTTYLPVRAVGQAIGKEVNWDGKTNSVFIGAYEGSKSSVHLVDLDYFNYQKQDSYGYRAWDSTSDKDNTGKQYSKGIVFMPYSSSSGKQYFEYLINQKYKSIKGAFVLNYKYRDKNKPAVLKIYGDDKLIYTSEQMKAGVLPIEFNIDITGVIKLKVEAEYTDSSRDSTEYSVVDTVLYE